MTDLVIISKHDKGFWQANLYVDAWEIPPSEFEAMGLSPDGFFTLKRGAGPPKPEHKGKIKR